MIIEVTAADIAHKSRSSRDCPGALAIGRALGVPVQVFRDTFGGYSACIGSPNGHCVSNHIPLPAHVSIKIRGWDNHGDMDPFSFEWTL